MAAEEEKRKEKCLSDIVKQFCDVTNCGEGEAEAIIKSNDIILQDAIDEFYEKEQAKVQMSDAVGNYEASSSYHCGFRLMTWNIDGLSAKEFKLRTLAIVERINSLKPHAVYLQEVVDDSLDLIASKCMGYNIYHHKIAYYYCAILIRKMPSLTFVSKDDTEFPQSSMGRFLMRVDVMYNGKPMSLLTTHLESCQRSSKERMSQLTQCFEKVADIGQESTVILAGDLNLRDKELEELGGLSGGIKDAWVEAGSNQSTKFSWDMLLNDNLIMPGGQKPRCRFDRVYYRPPTDRKVSLDKFDFVGKERLETCGCFPSDHFGILCDFSWDG